jgi:hypothetical protein
VQAIVKQLARGGSLPSRPLFMPLFFGAAAKVGGLPPQQFFTNPTKIANGLRQLQGPLQCDVLACYVDPTLIAEALGATIGWAAGLPDVLAPPPEIAPVEIENRGRIPIVLEVVRRLRAVLYDRVALAVALPGLLTTVQVIATPTVVVEGPALSDYLALAGGATLQAARLACEAGADLILLVENDPPAEGHPARAQWSAQMETICNVIRFYESLPVVLALHPAPGFVAVAAPGAMPCWPVETLHQLGSAGMLPKVPYGIALPAPQGSAWVLAEGVRQIRNPNCALVTTAGDLGPDIDPKDLRAYVTHLRQAACA